MDLYIARERYDRRSQCVGYPINAVLIDRKCRVIGLADRCPDNKRCLTERHSTGDANGDAAAVVVEQDRCQAACRNSGDKCLLDNRRVTYPDGVRLVIHAGISNIDIVTARGNRTARITANGDIVVPADTIKEGAVAEGRVAVTAVIAEERVTASRTVAVATGVVLEGAIAKR